MDRVLTDPTLSAIAQEISEKTGIEITYWCPDDDERNPEREHIFAVTELKPPEIAGVKQDLILTPVHHDFRCGHIHHVVELEGTILSIGECLKVDLNDPKSIDQLVELYTPKKSAYL